MKFSYHIQMNFISISFICLYKTIWVRTVVQFSCEYVLRWDPLKFHSKLTTKNMWIWFHSQGFLLSYCVLSNCDMHTSVFSYLWNIQNIQKLCMVFCYTLWETYIVVLFYISWAHVYIYVYIYTCIYIYIICIYHVHIILYIYNRYIN